jgi:hypothetical protein
MSGSRVLPSCVAIHVLDGDLVTVSACPVQTDMHSVSRALQVCACSGALPLSMPLRLQLLQQYAGDAVRITTGHELLCTFVTYHTAMQQCVLLVLSLLVTLLVTSFLCQACQADPVQHPKGRRAQLVSSKWFIQPCAAQQARVVGAHPGYVHQCYSAHQPLRWMSFGW